MHLQSRFSAALSAAVLLLLAAAPAAPALPPANDNFADATAVAALPFTVLGDLAEATVEPDEPAPCGYGTVTGWYGYTPSAAQSVKITVSGGFFVGAAIYEAVGPGITGLEQLSCLAVTRYSGVFSLTAGTTYYVRVSVDPYVGGSFGLEMQEAVPPANDNFADAQPMAPPPSSVTVDLAAATMEAGEPRPASSDITRSAWYSVTVAEGARLRVEPFPSWFTSSAFLGTSLETLVPVGVPSWGGTVWSSPAGATSWIQVGIGQPLFGMGTAVSLQLSYVPPPTARFQWLPAEPTQFETVRFVDQSTDPVGVASWRWDFGDGTTGTGLDASHRYEVDGDYDVTLTVTTPDGQTASSMQTVRVRTHDVAIMRMEAPPVAVVGRTFEVSADLLGGRYPEQVALLLLKSVAGGDDVVIGSLEGSVPVAEGGRTTRFRFSYTVVGDDAVAGKLTLRVVAAIVGGRDALGADNQAIAPPTRVVVRP